MKLIIALVLILPAYVWSQTNSPHFKTVTNFVNSIPSFREVNGQLYNTERSVLWTQFSGNCLSVSPKEIVVSTFTMKPIYEAVATTKIVHRGMFDLHGEPRLVSEKVKVDDEKIAGRKIILRNYPSKLLPAVGQELSFMAMRVGTSEYGGQTLEVWDYGTAHIVPVVRRVKIKAVKPTETNSVATVP